MKIIIVDDSKIMINLARDIIKNAEIVCTLEIFLDSIEALDYIEKNDVDLVITDYFANQILHNPEK